MMPPGHAPHPTEIIRSLVHRYEESKNKKGVTRLGAGGIERQLCNDYLNPFFEALGWDVRNQQGDHREVAFEEYIKGSRRKVDYSFRLKGKIRFLVEAKRPEGKLSAGRNIIQISEYSRQAGVPIVILTNFELFEVYCSRVDPTKTEPTMDDFVRVGCVHYREYERNWSRIESIFSRAAVYQGRLDDAVRFIMQSRENVDLFADPPPMPIRPPQAAPPIGQAPQYAPASYDARASYPTQQHAPPSYQAPYPAPASYHSSSQSAGSGGSKVLPFALLAGLVLLVGMVGIGAVAWMWLGSRRAIAGSDPSLPDSPSIGAEPGHARCWLDPWDGAVRAWDKGGSGLCGKAGTQAGYYLRVAYKRDKADSQAAVRRAWGRYIDVYAGGTCPTAKEMMFFDKNGDVGAGILFTQKPPRWDEVMQQELDWRLRDAREQPVTTLVCLFPADESRRPAGW